MKRRKSAVVGIFGKPKGPVAIFRTNVKKSEKRQRERELFFERAQTLAKPCEKSFDEVIGHLCDRYKAVPIRPSDSERRTVKINILLNHYPDLVHRKPLKENPSLQEIQQWQREDTSLDEARDYPEEKLGLVIEAYILPDEVSRELCRRQTAEEERSAGKKTISRAIDRWVLRRRKKKELERPEKPIAVLLERKHRYMVISGFGGSVLSDELALFGGISETDIREKTPRFKVYADLLYRRGVWK